MWTEEERVYLPLEISVCVTFVFSQSSCASWNQTIYEINAPHVKVKWALLRIIWEKPLPSSGNKPTRPDESLAAVSRAIKEREQTEGGVNAQRKHKEDTGHVTLITHCQLSQKLTGTEMNNICIKVYSPKLSCRFSDCFCLTEQSGVIRLSDEIGCVFRWSCFSPDSPEEMIQTLVQVGNWISEAGMENHRPRVLCVTNQTLTDRSETTRGQTK